MSGPWRFTDEHGVETAIGTEELRALLSSGKLPSATMVWRDGMDRQPAFTIAELASAAIAAARRSVPPSSGASSAAVKRSAPPPLPMRRPKSRPAMRTLTGIEPAEVEAALAMARGEEPVGGTKELHPPPPVEAPDTIDLPMVRGADVSGLADEESWNDATDVIPKAPSLPYDVLKLATPKPLIPTPPPPAVASVEDVPKRTTVMGIGQRQGLAPRPAAAPQASLPAATPRSKPPPPPQRKKSEPPPPPPRLQKTLELGLAKTDLGLMRPGAAPASRTTPAEAPQKGRSRPPPPPAHRKTDRMGAAAPAPASPGGGAAPASSTAAPKVPSRPPPRPPAATPQPPSVDLGAAPNADTLTAPVLAAEPEPASTRNVPTSYDLGEPAPRPKQSKTLEMAAPVPRAGASKTDRPPRPGEASTGAEAKRATNLEDAIRKPLSAEKTEIMIREAAAEPLPARSPTPTLEMALADHSAAASKDPAPPESKALKAKPSKTAKEATPPLETAAVSSRAPSSRPTPRVVENTDSTAVTEGEAERDDDDEDQLQVKRPAVQVPMSAVLGVSAAWVLGLVVFFFVGRVSGFKSAGNQPTAKEGLEQVFLEPGVMPVTTAVASAMTAAAAEPKPCWVTRQPRRWAESASKSVPFDMRPHGETIDLGFALGENKAAGLRIDPKAGTAENVFSSEVKSEISRVSPFGETFYVGEAGDKGFLPVPAAAPFYLVLEKGSIGAADSPDATMETLWKLEGEEPITAEQVITVGDAFLLTFRRGNDVMGGYFGADKKPKGELGKISATGSEERNGKPRAGTNGAEVVVAYAVETRLADDKKEWRLTLAKGGAGAIPANPMPLELPPNGPGGDAIAPDLIGLADGRWLVMWTEGTSGARAIRAQTYDKTFQAIGDPIALSPPAGSFGQAVLGVAGEYTTVAFLQAADEGFEMWGAVLRCGP